MQQSRLWSYFVLTLVTLARFVDGLPVSDNTTAIDCTQFFAPGPCVEYTGYPTNISGINVNLYRYANGWTTPNPTGDLNIAAINNAITTVLPVFHNFAPKFSVDVTLVTSNPNGDQGLTNPAAIGTPCYVRILQKANTGTDPSLQLEQVTTHELYHCVEYSNAGGGLPTTLGVDVYGWWKEGAPDYFAQKFFQNNDPTLAIKGYDPTVSLYSQSTSASLFFQFLSNQGWDDKTINDFVVKQIQSGLAGGSERTTMSSNADLQRLFPLFAQAFSDLKITFPDGSLAQGNPGTPLGPEIVLNDSSLQPNGQSIPVKFPSFAMTQPTITLKPGTTYTIQWAPAAQDGSTVLAYKQVGDTAWTTWDTTAPIQFPIDCSSALVQYKLLFTSTADADTTTGVLTITQSAQACGCSDLGIPLDPCFSGNWNLDLTDFQTYLSSRLSALQSVTISNVVASGASTFEFPREGMGAMTFSNLDIDYDATSSGYSFHTTIDMTGSVSGQVVMQGSGQFCWQNGQGQGDADTTTTVAGLGSPIVYDVPLTTGYVSPTITVNYMCSATSLQMEGYENGQYAWALSYLKV